MWEFKYTDSEEIIGPNEEFESFRNEGSIIREIVQNSIDALREEENQLKIQIEFKERNTADFPGKNDLISRLDKCNDTFYDDSRALSIFQELRTELDKKNHWLVSFTDLNTTGLEGGLTTDDRNTNMYKLIKSLGTTNKGTVKGTGGSFGVGKMAPFVKAGLRTVFYETKNSRENMIIGKTILASTIEKGKMCTPNGYYTDEEKLYQYIGRGAQSELGTTIHIPFYKLHKKNIESEIKSYIIDTLENFIIAIYDEELSIYLKSECMDTIIIKKNTLKSLIQLIEKDLHLMKKAEKAKLIEIKSIYKILELSEYNIEVQKESDVAIVRLSVGEAFEEYKKIYYIREQKMKIKSDKKKIQSFKSFAGIVEFKGSRINDILRQSENTKHTSWRKTNIHKKVDKTYFDEFFNDIYEKINQTLSSVTGEMINIDAINEERKMETTIKKISDKKSTTSKKTKGKMNAGMNQLKSRGTGGVKNSKSSVEGDHTVISYGNEIVSKIRSYNNIMYIDFIDEISKDTLVELFAQQDNGNSVIQEVRNYKFKEKNKETGKFSRLELHLNNTKIIPELKFNVREKNEINK